MTPWYAGPARTLPGTAENVALRRWRQLKRIARGALFIARGLADREHPLLVQIVPIRRCNIDCQYCNEYDKVSSPVPTEVMLRRIDRLAALRTEGVTFTGGEPMLHPDLDRLIARVADRGMIPGLITNAYPLSKERIERLNRAGLECMQISIDNVEPDDVSRKSLRLLDRKLQWLAVHAEFDVNINTVLGSGVPHPEDAKTIAARARALELSTSVGIIHDETGRLRPLSPAERAVHDEVSELGRHGRWLFKNLYSGLTSFDQNLIKGRPNRWWCRAGARYLYVCEDGIVHYCSQWRGVPGIPLEQYTVADIRREYRTRKPCAPLCTIGCVHRVSIMDVWRDPQDATAPLAAERRPARPHGASRPRPDERA